MKKTKKMASLLLASALVVVNLTGCSSGGNTDMVAELAGEKTESEETVVVESESELKIESEESAAPSSSQSASGYSQNVDIEAMMAEAEAEEEEEETQTVAEESASNSKKGEEAQPVAAEPAPADQPAVADMTAPAEQEQPAPQNDGIPATITMEDWGRPTPMFVLYDTAVKTEPYAASGNHGYIAKGSSIGVIGRCIETGYYRVNYGALPAYLPGDALSTEAPS